MDCVLELLRAAEAGCVLLLFRLLAWISAKFTYSPNIKHHMMTKRREIEISRSTWKRKKNFLRSVIDSSLRELYIAFGIERALKNVNLARWQTVFYTQSYEFSQNLAIEILVILSRSLAGHFSLSLSIGSRVCVVFATCVVSSVCNLSDGTSPVCINFL